LRKGREYCGRGEKKTLRGAEKGGLCQGGGGEEETMGQKKIPHCPASWKILLNRRRGKLKGGGKNSEAKSGMLTRDHRGGSLGKKGRRKAPVNYRHWKNQQAPAKKAEGKRVLGRKKKKKERLGQKGTRKRKNLVLKKKFATGGAHRRTLASRPAQGETAQKKRRHRPLKKGGN